MVGVVEVELDMLLGEGVVGEVELLYGPNDVRMIEAH